MRKVLLLAVLLPLLLTPATLASEKKAPRWNAATDTIEAEGIVVRFQERTPQYLVWIPMENDTAVYFIKFTKIVEFEDVDEDNFPDEAEILSLAPLTARDLWSVEASTVQHGNVTELIVRFVANVTVMTTKNASGVIGNPYIGETAGTAYVEFTNRIFSDNYTLDGYEIAGGRELKIDIVISDWPWQSNTSKLALEVVLAGMFHGKEGVPHCKQKQIRVRERNVREIKMQGEDTYQVAFRWSEEVQIREGVSTYEGYVNSSFAETKDSALVRIVYPHFNGTLIHDPSIVALGEERAEAGGVQSLIESVPGGVTTVAVAVGIVVIAVAVLIKRK